MSVQTHCQLVSMVSGEGSPVLLLHGQGGCGANWSFQREALAPYYRVIAPDLRGHGASEQPTGPYSIEMFSADVQALCQQLDVDSAHVIGHSLGGMVALQLALDAPALVRSLAIINSTSRGGGAWWRTFAIKTWIRLFGMASFARQNAHMHLPEPDQEELRQMLIETMGATSAAGYIATQQAVDPFDVSQRLHEIACPVLVLHSSDDLIPLADKEFIVDQVQRGKLVTIERSRHVSIWDQPQQVNDALLQFLTNCEA